MDELLQDWIAKQYEHCTYENKVSENDDWCVVTKTTGDKTESYCNQSVNSSFELISDKEVYNDQFSISKSPNLYRDNIYKPANQYGDNFDKSFAFVEKKRCEELPFIDEDPALWINEHGEGGLMEGGECPRDNSMKYTPTKDLEILADDYEESVEFERNLQEDVEKKFIPYEFWDSVPAKNKNQKKREPFPRQRLKQHKNKKLSKWRNALKNLHYS